MIIGLGTDLIAVDRIARVYCRHPRRFLERTYHPLEQQYCLQAKEPAERLAARWATKEATMKALGTGWQAGIQFVDIALFNQANGAPRLQLFNQAKKLAEQLRINTWHCSISHADGFAMATVIAEIH